MVYYIRHPQTGKVLCSAVNTCDLASATLQPRNLNPFQCWVVCEGGWITTKELEPNLDLKKYDYTKDGMLIDSATGQALLATVSRTTVSLSTSVHNNMSMQWAFVPHAFPAENLEIYMIRHPSSNMFLHVKSGGKENGTDVELWERNGTGALYWKLEPDGTLWNPQSNKCLTAKGFELGHYHASIEVWEKECSSGSLSHSQAWQFTMDGMILHVVTGKVLTYLPSDQTLRLSPFNHSDLNQQWMIIPQSWTV
jgi:hypothetical protein